MYDDDMGFDDVGAMFDVGARRRARGRRRSVMSRPPQSAMSIRSQPPLIPGLAGANSVSYKELPLGFGSQTFSSVSGTQLTFTASPQAAIRGRRFVGSVARTGTTSTGLVLVTSILVGTDNMMVGTGGIPIETFAGGSFGTDMMVAAAIPGLTITIVCTISAAPTTTDTVVVGWALIGGSVK